MPRAKKAAYPEFWISARIQVSSMPAPTKMPKKHTLKQDVNSPSNLTFWCHFFILKSDALKGAKILHMTRIVSHVETVPVAGAIPGRSKRRHPCPSRERAPRSTTAKKLFRKSCPSWQHPITPHPRSSSLEWFLQMTYILKQKINSWDVSPFTTFKN